MTKVLLKRVGKLTNEEYISEVENIARIAVAEQIKHNPYLEIYSYKELIQGHQHGHVDEAN